jgi:hypothetical protein
MVRCAALANQRKIVENILSEASDERLHQRVRDHLRDIETQQQNQGCLQSSAITDGGTLTGRITLWTDNGLLPGPVQGGVGAMLVFLKHTDDDAWSVRIDTLTASLPSGVTAGLQNHSVGTGVFDQAAGSIGVEVPLRVQNIPLIGSVDARVPFTTGGSIATSSGSVKGARVDADGRLTLVGAASGIGPFGNKAWLVLEGGLSDWPRQ